MLRILLTTLQVCDMDNAGTFATPATAVFTDLQMKDSGASLMFNKKEIKEDDILGKAGVNSKILIGTAAQVKVSATFLDTDKSSAIALIEEINGSVITPGTPVDGITPLTEVVSPQNQRFPRKFMILGTGVSKDNGRAVTFKLSETFLEGNAAIQMDSKEFKATELVFEGSTVSECEISYDAVAFV